MASEVIADYHDLWHVEQSFRISKTDLRARPMFHRTCDAIEAHLTIVFTALAAPARHRDDLLVGGRDDVYQPVDLATGHDSSGCL